MLTNITYKSMDQDNNGYFTVAEVAKILGISRIAVYKRIKVGKMPVVKIGTHFVIPKESLAAIIDGTLDERKKQQLRKAIKKTIDDYGETLRLLGKE
jgi:excisionase family DNA binding protein